ncbi:hypothetical protein [Helicobacter salomonis]|uniref:hypothetical protein n=1 Tax=Helicobacter salomonis TaxID=56878 RepID=UPI000CF10F5A|nr:hypothetical protein [Helicobacter salomonis]
MRLLQLKSKVRELAKKTSSTHRLYRMLARVYNRRFGLLDSPARGYAKVCDFYAYSPPPPPITTPIGKK